MALFLCGCYVETVGSCLRIGFPMLQSIAGDLEVHVPRPAPAPVLLLCTTLSQARIKSRENPSKDRQHQEN